MLKELLKNGCVLGLTLVGTSTTLWASMPNLEGATYICKGKELVIEVSIGAQSPKECSERQCLYDSTLVENGVQKIPNIGRPWPAIACQDDINSWNLFVWGDKFQLLSQIDVDGTIAGSNYGPIPFSHVPEGQVYPAVVCTLTLKH